MDQLTDSPNIVEQAGTEAEMATQDIVHETKVGISDIKGFIQTYRTELVVGAGVLFLFMMLKK